MFTSGKHSSFLVYTVLRVLTNAYNYVVDREQFFAPPKFPPVPF